MAFIRLGKNKKQKKLMLKQVQQNNEDVKQNQKKLLENSFFKI